MRHYIIKYDGSIYSIPIECDIAIKQIEQSEIEKIIEHGEHAEIYGVYKYNIRADIVRDDEMTKFMIGFENNITIETEEFPLDRMQLYFMREEKAEREAERKRRADERYEAIIKGSK